MMCGRAACNGAKVSEICARQWMCWINFFRLHQKSFPVGCNLGREASRAVRAWGHEPRASSLYHLMMRRVKNGWIGICIRVMAAGANSASIKYTEWVSESGRIELRHSMKYSAERRPLAPLAHESLWLSKESFSWAAAAKRQLNSP